MKLLPRRRLEDNQFQRQQASDAPVSLGGSLGAVWEEPTITGLLGERIEQSQLSGRINRSVSPTLPLGVEAVDPPTPKELEIISAEQLTAEYSKYGLQFDTPMTRGAADALAEGKRRELVRQSLVQRSPSGVGTLAAQFSTALLRSALDPIELAAAFFPVVSAARMAALTARFGPVGGRAAAGAIEGTVGNILLEPAYFGLSRSLQRDYTMSDSLVNVLLGTVLGGTLGAGAGGIARLRQRAPVNVSSVRQEAEINIFAPPVEAARTTPEVNIFATPEPGVNIFAPPAPYYGVTPAERGDAFRGAVAQVLQGKRVEVEGLLPRTQPESTPKITTSFRDGNTFHDTITIGDTELAAAVTKDGSTLRVESVSVAGLMTDAEGRTVPFDDYDKAREAHFNKIGPRVIRSVLSAYKEKFPDVTKITGERIGGARFSGKITKGKGKEISLSLQQQRERAARESAPERDGLDRPDRAARVAEAAAAPERPVDETAVELTRQVRELSAQGVIPEATAARVLDELAAIDAKGAAFERATNFLSACIVRV